MCGDKQALVRETKKTFGKMRNELVLSHEIYEVFSVKCEPSSLFYFILFYRT